MTTTTIATWPVADWRQVVRAYKPGEAPAESPLRTLKKHRWTSNGVRVTRRTGGALGGQVKLFSSLNLDSARLARHGRYVEAVRVANAAATLEAGPEFSRLQDELANLPGTDAQQVVDGILPDNAPSSLAAALKAAARRTEQLRAGEPKLPESQISVSIGRIAEVHEGYVILALLAGPSTAVPRWMAHAIRRDSIGAFLALITDRLDGHSAIVEALPAIGLDDFSPFGRGEPRVLALTEDDTKLLAGEPAPLRILVPVTIESIE